MIERHFVADGMRGSAVFSDDEKYRYDLTRQWAHHLEGVTAPPPTCAFVMLNPSTATEEVLDPTIRRCIGFAKTWGYGRLIVRNAFALRSTDPKALKVDTDPVGPDNDEWLRKLKREATLIVAAWGAHAKLYARDRAVRRLLEGHNNVLHLGLTQAGQPKHPLYIPADTIPEKL